MAYINLEKEFLEKNKIEMEKLSISEIGEDGKDCLRYDDDCIGHIDEINPDSISVTLEASKIGYISFDVKLDDDDYIQLIENAVKKMNKLKNIMESLKSV